MMTTTSLEPPRSRRRFIVGVFVASAMCLIALALFVVPSRFNYQTRVYQGGQNTKPIASFTINVFVARYHQDSKPFDPSSPEAAGMPYAKSMTTVNTVEWSVESRRVAAVLMIAAVLLILRIARRHRGSAQDLSAR